MQNVNRKQAAGLTLIELIVTVAIAAILMAVATPYWATMQKKNQAGAMSRSIVTAFNYARSEAVTLQQEVSVIPTDGADWGNGLTVWTDENGNNVMDSNDDEILQIYGALDGATVTSSLPIVTVTYDRDGDLRLPLATVTFTMQIENCDSRIEGRIITVNQNGRLEVETTPCT